MTEPHSMVILVINGGAPVTQEYASLVGSANYAYYGSERISICKELMKGRE